MTMVMDKLDLAGCLAEKKRLGALDMRYWKMAFETETITKAQFRKKRKALEAEQQALKNQMLSDPELRSHVLDMTVYFQASNELYPGLDGNYRLQDELVEAFPQGHGDSESGQGFFYISSQYVLEVVEWLKGKGTARVGPTLFLSIK